MMEVELSGIDFGRFVPPGGLVAWGQGCAEPAPLTHALMTQRAKIGRFRVFVGGSFSGSVDLLYAEDIAYTSYIAMGRNADLARAGKLLVLPTAYSQIADALGQVDLLIAQAAEGPDGQLRYAMACEYLGDLERYARAIMVEINAEAPLSPDAPVIDRNKIVAVVRTTRPPIEMPGSESDGTMRQIGDIVAGLIEDGSTLQIGVGNLPDAVLGSLHSHRDLGIHSGAIGDGVAALIEAGVVNNARKAIHRGVTVAGVFFGGARLNRLAHGNGAITLAPTSYTHNQRVIGGIDRFVSLNSAIEVDLSGAVNSEVANGAYVGGVGGAAEFTRAAALSLGGRPIIATASTAARGRVSRIVAKLSGPTTISRSDAGLVVTEFGAVDLRGRSLDERRRLMLSIAHPDFREQLEAAATI